MSKDIQPLASIRGDIAAKDEDGKDLKPGDHVYVKCRCRVVTVTHDEGCEPVALVRSDGKFKVERWR